MCYTYEKEKKGPINNGFAWSSRAPFSFLVSLVTFNIFHLPGTYLVPTYLSIVDLVCSSV
jgi:hypothetical protein